MKVDKLEQREILPVKAIHAYINEYQVISSLEMDYQQQFKTVVATGGSGLPTLFLDRKYNEKRGVEIDIVFTGKRNVEKLEKSSVGWATFGHIVLGREHARQMIDKLERLLE